MSAVVLSPASYNEKVGLAVFCPITNHVKGYPFEVIIPPGSTVAGAVLSDQVKSLDWRARRAERIGRLPAPYPQGCSRESPDLASAPCGIIDLTASLALQVPS